MLHFSVAADDAAFLAEVGSALAALAARPGYRGSRLGRSFDDPQAWVLLVEWGGVGDYRRALSGYDVRVATAPLLARVGELPSAYEVLRTDGPDGLGLASSDRSPD